MSADAVTELFHRMQAAEQSNLRNELGLGSHEQQCTIRYAHINQTMNAIKRDIRWAAIAVITGLAGILTKLMFFT